MPLQISKGQDQTKVKLEVDALLENGWVVKDDILLEKKYHLKTYTKVVVRRQSSFLSKADVVGSAQYDCNKKQIKQSSCQNAHRTNPSPVMTTEFNKHAGIRHAYGAVDDT